ncbi:hypothetical protein FIBSPDRAFT_955301 [Athelia psychrophila]|uniref:G-patch domain-containing protein n=1 Tax=Athelia psychrophila TaxID=1759441 RepID=A0A166IBI0_9AGAM|nr:hypothetical protein FIBSPDRAFT_955301 [Fibularhizoctonia sp. CBS 109695]
MGLSGRKEKQRIPHDPRNLSWAGDASKFGTSYLSKFGWDPSKGLGAAGDGRTSHIKVAQKLDMLGIGNAHMNDPNAVAWRQNKDFEALLKRLNEGREDAVIAPAIKEEGAAEADDGGEGKEGEKKRKRRERADEDGDSAKKGLKKRKSSPAGEGVVVVAEPPKVAAVKVSASRPMAHRARNRASKNLSNKSAAEIAEILGIAPTPAASTAQLPGTLTQIDDAPAALEKLTTSARSMADYFRDRLKLKSGGAPADSAQEGGGDGDGDGAYGAPRGGLGASRGIGMGVKGEDEEAPKMGLGMSKFGSLMSGAFLASLGAPAEAEEPSVESAEPVGESAEQAAEKKASRKAEKKAKREAKEAQQPIVEDSEDVEKTRRKAEKKARREAKEVQQPTVEDSEDAEDAEEMARGYAEEMARREAEKQAKREADEQSAAAEQTVSVSASAEVEEALTKAQRKADKQSRKEQAMLDGSWTPRRR